ncbi:uncharacterized protein BO80DRAFT_100455 [Aspergillus ibericus CBS 121593]|uniref:Uncharacterized protein n=1 Tax=Aspergillus ibericus CBS 121593 TaxID=1448316 RepID=A0A395GYR5_9EURO|nr:hypothetical protein BO80DRAFT_100455 [Aspergillus ibericus CBS 121593]RAL00500.1 hypothetical protein BO80DRAFT_100455 [Aspergillus ibericus CBS 121593]
MWLQSTKLMYLLQVVPDGRASLAFLLLPFLTSDSLPLVLDPDLIASGTSSFQADRHGIRDCSPAIYGDSTRDFVCCLPGSLQLVLFDSLPR